MKFLFRFMSIAIATQNLSKTYKAGFWKTKSLHALDDLNLEVRENEIFGYLGPNGAGKSTTFKLLMSLIYPSSGRAEILGKSVYDLKARSKIGYLPENPYFYEHLTAEEFLRFYGSFFRVLNSGNQKQGRSPSETDGHFPRKKTPASKVFQGNVAESWNRSGPNQ